MSPLRLRGGAWGTAQKKKKKDEDKMDLKEWIGVGLRFFIPSLLKKATGFVLLWTLIRMDQLSQNPKPEDEDDAEKLKWRIIRPNFSFTRSTDFPDISTTDAEKAAEFRARQSDEESLRLVQKRNNEILAQLETGDHIKVAGAFGFKSMAHHAIYVGNNEIVHFTGGASADTSLDAKFRARITRESVSQIVNLANDGRCIMQVVPMPENAFPRDQIVARSLTRVGDAGYNLVLSNCEHFAQWCVTGLKRSDQVLMALGAPIRFLQQAVEDLVVAAEHPIHGKPIRKAGNTVRAVVGIIGLHLAFVAW